MRIETPTIVFSAVNIPAPTGANQVLQSTSATTVAWNSKLQLGTTPSATAAINVDASSFATNVFHSVNGTSQFDITHAVNGSIVIGMQNTSNAMIFSGGGQQKWAVSIASAGVSEFTSQQNTARIVGGSSNGLAIRNSGNTRDNFSIADNGSNFSLNDGTRVGTFALATQNGAFPAGIRFYASNNFGVSITPDNGAIVSAQSILVMGYWANSTPASAVQIANTASTAGTLGIMLAGGYIEKWGSAAGGGDAGSVTEFRKQTTGIADNTATSVITVTIPNGSHSAYIRLRIRAALGAGGAVGADEASGLVQYDVIVTRVTGVNAVRNAAASTVTTVSVAGGTTITVTPTLAAVAGAVGAVNTFDVQITIARGGGASTNHTCDVYASVLNQNASGITVS